MFCCRNYYFSLKVSACNSCVKETITLLTWRRGLEGIIFLLRSVVRLFNYTVATTLWSFASALRAICLETAPVDNHAFSGRVASCSVLRLNYLTILSAVIHTYMYSVRDHPETGSFDVWSSNEEHAIVLHYCARAGACYGTRHGPENFKLRRH
jgi:hypothetical protein